MNIFQKHQIVINIIFDYNYGFEENTIKKIIKKTIDITFDELSYDYYKGCEVNVLLASNEQIKKLNKKYRKINKATNVLAFSHKFTELYQRKKKLLFLGDIALSLDKIRSEAENQSKKFENHLMHIVMHGFMHLLGFDHKNAKESKIMEDKEKYLLSKLSIADPYI